MPPSSYLAPHDHLGQAELVIDLGAIVKNWRALREMSRSKSCAAVVKANAYGLGMIQVARVLQEAGCTHFFVAHLAEALTLRDSLGPEPFIHVLHGPQPATEHVFLRADLVPVLNSMDQIRRFTLAASDAGVTPRVALQVDTGMARLGLRVEEFQVVCQQGGLAGLEVKLLMSHLVSAEDPMDRLNWVQLEAFERARRLLPEVPASFANSSGIFLSSAFHFDLLRPGAALYGVAPISGASNPMQQVVRLRAPLIQTRLVDAGEGVGYNHLWRAQSRSVLATIGLGYADGFMRSLSNQALLAVGGIPVKQVGRVSMDTIVVDVSHIPERYLNPGQMFDVLHTGNDINDLAAQAGTNAYEVLTQLGQRYARRYVH